VDVFIAGLSLGLYHLSLPFASPLLTLRIQGSFACHLHLRQSHHLTKWPKSANQVHFKFVGH
jgi:hypothetical protein